MNSDIIWNFIRHNILEIIAVVISIWAFRKSQKASEKVQRLQEAEFYLSRANMYEGRIAEWPSALELHGIREKELEQNGVKRDQLLYLINSLNALFAWSNFSGTDAYDHLTKSHYRQRMFAQNQTRKVWKFAREFFLEKFQEKIDKYIRENPARE